MHLESLKKIIYSPNILEGLKETFKNYCGKTILGPGSGMALPTMVLSPQNQLKFNTENSWGTCSIA